MLDTRPSPCPSPSPKSLSQIQRGKGKFASGLSLKSYGPQQPTHPITFKRGWSEREYIVQIPALSATDSQEGVPSLKGGQLEEEHGVVHHFQREHYQRKVLRV